LEQSLLSMFSVLMGYESILYPVCPQKRVSRIAQKQIRDLSKADFWVPIFF
jgi:hypothetical protein